MPEPTFGHQPDDPGSYARNCVCCGRDECRRCPGDPEPWWAHALRLVDAGSCMSRLLRRVKRDLASLDAWLGGEQ